MPVRCAGPGAEKSREEISGASAAAQRRGDFSPPPARSPRSGAGLDPETASARPGHHVGQHRVTARRDTAGSTLFDSFELLFDPGEMITATKRPRPPRRGQAGVEHCQRIEGVVVHRHVWRSPDGGTPTLVVDAETDTVEVRGVAPGGELVEVGDRVVVIATRLPTGIYNPHSIEVA